MTEGHWDYPTTDTETQRLPAVPASSGSAGGQGQKPTEVAKEQGGQLAQGAVESGQQLASTAKDQVSAVTAETGRQARDLLDQARTELTQQATGQQQRLADGLRSLGSELRSMSRSSEQSGLGADLAHQGAQLTDQVASWFDGREPSAVLQDVRGFARRRPGTFLLVAAGAGLLAGRLTRGLKDEASSSGDSAGSGGSYPGSGGSYPGSGGSFTSPPAVGPISDVPAVGAPIPGTYVGGGAPTQAMPVQPVPEPDEVIPFAGDDGAISYPPRGEL